jgi:hypothetical protein
MPDTFNYSIADMLDPVGANDLGSRAAFYQRSLYKETVYPPSFPPPLDVWYNKLLYGRVDQYQNSIIPLRFNLTTIPHARRADIQALNVVVRAFEKFVSHMQKATTVGAVNAGGNPRMLDVQAARGYESPHLTYAYFTQGLCDTFVNSLDGEQSASIKDFYSFLTVYRDYLLNIAYYTPVTKSNYILTPAGSMFSGGLSIAISNDNAGNDTEKSTLFTKDSNFTFFRSCAKKFGFTLNKNAPWIMTADLFSTAFLETACWGTQTATGAFITKDNFFEAFYEKTCLRDFDDLITILVNSYKSLVDRSPFYEDEGAHMKAYASDGHPVGRVGTSCPVKSIPRKPLNITAEAALNSAAGASVIPFKLLIDLYIDLRQAEIKNPLTSIGLRSLRQQAYEVYHVRPDKDLTQLQNVAIYVNGVFRNYIYDYGAMDLQYNNGVDFEVDNRVKDGRILVEKNIKRQLY